MSCHVTTGWQGVNTCTNTCTTCTHIHVLWYSPLYNFTLAEHHTTPLSMQLVLMRREPLTNVVPQLSVFMILLCMIPKILQMHTFLLSTGSSMNLGHSGWHRIKVIALCQHFFRLRIRDWAMRKSIRSSVPGSLFLH